MKSKKLKIRFVKLRSLVHCAVILLISSQMMGKEMGVQTTSQGPQVDEIYAAWSDAASRSMVSLRVLSSVYTQKDVNRGSNWMGKPRVTSYKESTILSDVWHAEMRTCNRDIDLFPYLSFFSPRFPKFRNETILNYLFYWFIHSDICRINLWVKGFSEVLKV